MCLKSPQRIQISALAVCCATFMFTFGCVVGVNPAPTILSRSSLHCIAPWQFYCTSFLGHDALHSGRFPSVCVEESGGPSRLQCFIPISDRCRGNHAAHTLQMKDVDSTCKHCSPVTGPPWHSEDTNLVHHRQTAQWRLSSYTCCTVAALRLSPQAAASLSFCPTYQGQVSKSS